MLGLVGLVFALEEILALFGFLFFLVYFATVRGNGGNQTLELGGQ